MKENVSRPARSRLRRTEERLKYILREQIAELASLLEVVISVLVLLGLHLCTAPAAQLPVPCLLWMAAGRRPALHGGRRHLRLQAPRL